MSVVWVKVECSARGLALSLSSLGLAVALEHIGLSPYTGVNGRTAKYKEVGSAEVQTDGLA